MDINQEVQERNASASLDDNLEKGEIYTNSKNVILNCLKSCSSTGSSLVSLAFQEKVQELSSTWLIKNNWSSL